MLQKKDTEVVSHEHHKNGSTPKSPPELTPFSPVTPDFPDLLEAFLSLPEIAFAIKNTTQHLAKIKEVQETNDTPIMQIFYYVLLMRLERLQAQHESITVILEKQQASLPTPIATNGVAHREPRAPRTPKDKPVVTTPTPQENSTERKPHHSSIDKEAVTQGAHVRLLQHLNTRDPEDTSGMLYPDVLEGSIKGAITKGHLQYLLIEGDGGLRSKAAAVQCELTVYDPKRKGPGAMVTLRYDRIPNPTPAAENTNGSKPLQPDTNKDVVAAAVDFLAPDTNTLDTEIPDLDIEKKVAFLQNAAKTDIAAELKFKAREIIDLNLAKALLKRVGLLLTEEDLKALGIDKKISGIPVMTLQQLAIVYEILATSSSTKSYAAAYKLFLKGETGSSASTSPAENGDEKSKSEAKYQELLKQAERAGILSKYKYDEKDPNSPLRKRLREEMGETATEADILLLVIEVFEKHRGRLAPNEWVHISAVSSHVRDRIWLDCFESKVEAWKMRRGLIKDPEVNTNPRTSPSSRIVSYSTEKSEESGRFDRRNNQSTQKSKRK